MVFTSVLALGLAAHVHTASHGSGLRVVPRVQRAGVFAGQVSEPSKEGAAEPSIVGGSISVDDELPESKYVPGSEEELADMRAKVVQYQAELDAQRESTEFAEKLEEEEGGFLGDSIYGFVTSAIASIKEYEVPNTSAMAQKMGLSLGALVISFLLVTLIDGTLIETLRPIVKYQVDNTPAVL